MRYSISVLITYYNERHLLAECLRSCAPYLHASDEILIYDDASHDPAIDYVPADISARVIRGEVNRGPAVGRNILLAESRCNYIHFHDSDDLFTPEWRSKVGAALDYSHVDVVFTEVESFRGSQLISNQVLGLSILDQQCDLLRFCIRGAMLVPSGTYRRQRIVELGGYREQFWQSEDWDFHIRLAATNPSYQLIDEPLVRIRLRSDGRSTQRGEVYMSALQILRTQAQELPQIYHKDLAERSIMLGSQCFQLGLYPQARSAFYFAYEIGPPDFVATRPMYRMLARTFGPEPAEWVSLAYRKLIPECIRRRAIKQGL